MTTTPTPPEQSAEDAYENATIDATLALERIEAALNAPPSKINWGHVSSLNDLVRILNAAATSMEEVVR